jgi:hypothetical protein
MREAETIYDKVTAAAASIALMSSARWLSEAAPAQTSMITKLPKIADAATPLPMIPVLPAASSMPAIVAVASRSMPARLRKRILCELLHSGLWLLRIDHRQLNGGWISLTVVAS